MVANPALWRYVSPAFETHPIGQVAHMTAVLLIVHLIIALALVALVLLQRSEGGALGIGGGGGGGNLFSSRGVGNVLTRATAFLAAVFFATSIMLTILAQRGSAPVSPFDTVEQPAGVQGEGTPAGEGGDALPQLPPMSGGSDEAGGSDEPQVPLSE